KALRDEVWRRDSGRCSFTNNEGARCPATSWLEIDHIRPYALGGRSDDIDNLRLLCRAHNQMMARRIFNYPRDRWARTKGSLKPGLINPNNAETSANKPDTQ